MKQEQNLRSSLRRIFVCCRSIKDDGRPNDGADDKLKKSTGGRNSTNTATQEFFLEDQDGNPKLDRNGDPIMVDGIPPDSLPGKSFQKRESDGTFRGMRVVEQIGAPIDTKFKCRCDKDGVEDVILTYNDIMNSYGFMRVKDK